jgi:outer membrane biosynthesis protein TonB
MPQDRKKQKRRKPRLFPLLLMLALVLTVASFAVGNVLKNEKLFENKKETESTQPLTEEKKTEEEICPKCGKEVSACECEPETEHAKKKKEDEEKKPEDGEKKPSEEPAKEEPKEDKKSEEPKEDKKSEEPAKKEEPAEEDEEEKKKKAKSKYNLVEETELSALQEKYDGLSANYEALQSEVEGLREFKKTAERKDKQAMIDSFTMLGDTEKADVVENIDKYSVDEIEAKLAVVCLRNKISFSVEEESTANSQVNTSFNLNETQEDDMPAWLRAVKATKDSEN